MGILPMQNCVGLHGLEGRATLGPVVTKWKFPMCGITGVFDYRSTGLRLEPRVLDAMVDSLAHRGPNARGTWRGDGIWLGHRRLSILDPTPAGAQPMTYGNGT